MDDDLQRLERAHAQDPGDAAVAAQLQAALLRAGRRDDLRGRYELAFVCDQEWARMSPTARPDVRRCGECKREVHLARTYADVDRLGAAGHCAAVVAAELPRVLDGLIDAPGPGLARAPGDPCLLTAPPPPSAPTVAPPGRWPIPAGGLRPVPLRPPPTPVSPTPEPPPRPKPEPPRPAGQAAP